eukprot:CAMPEP_0118872604 /NCGR_PEP_ID=MMETSP1163-20130328/14727_1 /TAXON_ID=124430 /ORGANISM="Phaeomonas parva, Strain CCMP2877" /LENGTH=992 /DNA_ID=CAMNT_0006807807 /DNA_START=31 /DNA_END=3009 /DNA_ORIENTATION=+
MADQKPAATAATAAPPPPGEQAPLTDAERALLEGPASSIHFAQLCKGFQRMSQPGLACRTKLDILLNDRLAEHVGHSNSLWPLLRLVLPQMDGHRPSYGLQEAALTKLIGKAMDWSKSSCRKRSLENYKRPEMAPTNPGGDDPVAWVTADFPSCAAYLVKERCAGRPSTYTLGEINEQLDILAGKQGSASKAKVVLAGDWKVNLLRKLIRKLSALEFKWLLRIVLKGGMKINLSDQAILRRYHPKAEALLASTFDLRNVCENICRDPERALLTEENVVDVARPFQCMLAARLGQGGKQLNAVLKSLKGKPFVCDIKLDGERMLLHKKGPKLVMCSRNNAQDYTEKYSPTMATLLRRNIRASDVVLDGEICAWDSMSNKICAFGANKSVAMENESKTGRHLFYIVFDILYLRDNREKVAVWVQNAQARLRREAPGLPSISDDVLETQGSLTHLPLYFRRALLREVIDEKSHKFELVKHLEVLSADAAERRTALRGYFKASLEREEEGLVVKNLESPYVLGEKSRRTHSWVKLKPDYSSKLGEYVDCLVLGGMYSTGTRRGGKITTLLVGVRGSPREDDPESKRFYTLGVSAGLNDREVEEFMGTYGSYFVDYDKDNPPKEWAPWEPKKKAHRPDVVVPYDKSLIMEVLAAEIVPSDVFAARHTFRFPRNSGAGRDGDDNRYTKPMRLRTDLDYTQAADLAFVQLSREDRKARRVAAQVVAPPENRKRDRKGKRLLLTVRAEDQVAHLKDDTERESDLFSGWTFCVMPGSFEDPPVPGDAALTGHKRMQLLLQQHGAEVVANNISKFEGVPVGPDDFEHCSVAICSAGSNTRKLKNLKSLEAHQMLYHTWVLRCVEEGVVVDVHFDEVYAAFGELRQSLSERYDPYGDPYEEDATAESFQGIMKRMKLTPPPFPDAAFARVGVSVPAAPPLALVVMADPESVDDDDDGAAGGVSIADFEDVPEVAAVLGDDDVTVEQMKACLDVLVLGRAGEPF